MAGISYSNNGGLNPSNSYMPYRNGGVFADSIYRQVGNKFGSTKLGDFAGFYGDTAFDQYWVGSETLGGYIIVDAQSKIIGLNADTVEYNGASLESATAGGSAGSHLVLKINGNIRKIALLLP